MGRLLIFAHPGRHETARAELKDRFPEVVFSCVGNGRDLRAALSAGEAVEAVAVDPCGLPAGWKQELEAVARAYPHVPFISLPASDAGRPAAQNAAPARPNHSRAVKPVRSRLVFTSLEDLRARREWRRVLASLTVPALLVNGRGVILDANEAAGAPAGLPAQALLGRQCHSLFHRRGERPENCPLVRARKTKKHVVAQVRLPSGSAYLACCTPVIGRYGDVQFFVHITLDLKAQEQAEMWRQVAERVLEATTEGVVVTDADRVIWWVNNVFTELTGYGAEEVVGRTPFFLVAPPGAGDPLPREAEAHLAGGSSWQGQMWYRKKIGEVFSRWVTISPVRDREGRVLHYVSVCTNVAYKTADPKSVARVTHCDALTGLGNRLQYYDRFEAATSLALCRGLSLALFYLDLDRFSSINAAFGYAAGDEVLKAVGQRLKAAVRDEDTVVRVAGDEFALLLVLERQEEAAALGRKMLAYLREPVSIAGRHVVVSGSRGIAFYPGDAYDPDKLLWAARAAADRAKEQGRGSFAFYGRELQAAFEKSFAVEQELGRAIEGNEMAVYYQPRLNLQAGRISGVEALVRWQHPHWGLLLPGAFIDVAEASGLIVPLDDMVIWTACKQARAWERNGYSLTVSVNLSARQFLRDDFIHKVKRVLKETELDPGLLELEITETTAVKDVELTSSLLATLRSLGIGIAIDDFGTGYGSLRYLKHFPATTLKIDRSFVQGLPENRQDKAIAAAVIALARSLGCVVVAEGVEAPEQLAWLKEQGCDEGQGFLFSPPVPPNELELLLRAGGVAPPR
ncbi:MAG: EAL domain-containing protein [Clostridia bacterium]|nr:MAG: EAL domain-containing protein [Clostridia bacterium]